MRGFCKRVLGAMACAAVLVVVPGCGGGGELDPVDRGELGKAEQLVTAEQVRRAPAGSPERSLLQWWRDTQFSNFEGHLDGYVRSVRAGQARRRSFSRRNLSVLSLYLRTGRPDVDSTEPRGDDVVLFTTLRFNQRVGSDDVSRASFPQAFTMRREDRRWRLVNDAFAESAVRNVRGLGN